MSEDLYGRLYNKYWYGKSENDKDSRDKGLFSRKFEGENGVTVSITVEHGTPDSIEAMEALYNYIQSCYYAFDFGLRRELVEIFPKKDEYFLCPRCGTPLLRKSEIEKYEGNYCGECGTPLADAKKKWRQPDASC